MIFVRALPSLAFLRTLRTALALGGILAFGACGNNPNPKPLHEKRPDGSPWVVRYSYMPDEARSLDPQVEYDQMSQYVEEMVQDRLMQYAPMKTDPYEVEPCMLAGMPERTQNADGTVTYLCRLKPGILFHNDPCFYESNGPAPENAVGPFKSAPVASVKECPLGKGREVVAADVQFAFQRICDPAVVCPVAEVFFQHVAGMKEASDAAKKAGRYDYDQNLISGFEVIDAHTFKLRLLGPYPQIVYWLALYFTAPVAHEAVKYYGPLFKFHPVGTGPFLIAEHTEGQFYRMVRNPDYHTTVFPSGGWPPEREAVNRPLAGHALPLVDEVQFKVFKEILPVWLLARQGYLDRMSVMKDAANSAISTTRELAPKYAKRGMRLVRALEPSTFYLVFNMQDPLLGQNKKLRQALSCAYNAKGYADMAYGGVAPVAQQLVPPGIFGYEKDLHNPYGFNLEKAHQLMVEAGYPNGIDPATGRPLEISMDVNATGGEERQLAEYEQRQLEQTGIKVRIVEDSFARLTQKEEEGNYQISSSGWGADYPDAENFMFLFYSKNFPPDGANYARYHSPEFDAFFEKMATMENTPERLEIIHKMTALLEEDCPFALNFHRGYYVIEQPWAPMTQSNELLERGLEYDFVDPVLREQKRREWNPVARWPIPIGTAAILAAAIYAAQLNRRRNV